MAEETTGDQQSQEPNGDAQQQPEVDYKAKYEATLAHSREWEKRAKANKAAADELEQLKESQMSEAQKAEARTARLQKELDMLKAEKQSNEWRAQVAEESGLPASLIVGDSLESMQTHAKAISDYIAEKTKPAGIPAPTNGTVLPETPGANPGAQDLARAFEKIGF
ncbi:helicase [Bifidobacterium sp. UTCIF-39]|uniref:DUF4355 domain-containing protein n=1 Tax=Bifidobacterium sp. UTCIF-39 TaxID=1465359 RepID=UPI00112C6062|nr:DUF4355 domain-containing protein [Bifidobacterium sp. UTCIF-39]TPF95333.1 helicase [Bifidobacterium sp. UTCIF-39]